MATYHWTGAAGNWSNSADWVTYVIDPVTKNTIAVHALPGAGDIADISGAGANVTVDTSAAASVAEIDLVGGALTLTGAATYGGSIHASSAANLILQGGPLRVSGAVTFASATVTGASTWLYTYAATTLSGLTLANAAFWGNVGTATQTGGSLTLGDGSGARAVMVNTASGVFKLADDNGIGRGASTASSVLNWGLFEKTGGFGASVISARFVSTGVVAIASGTLSFSSDQNNFQGSIGGSGVFKLGAGVSSFTAAKISVANWSILGSGTRALVATSLNYAGNLSLGTGAAIGVSAGATLSLSGTTTLAGSVDNKGGLTLSGGLTTINAGANISTSSWTLAGPGAATLNESLSYGGAFRLGAGATLSLSGASTTLSLLGSVAITGGIIKGSQALRTTQAVSLSGGTIGGTVGWTNAGVVTQTGGNLTIGDASGSVAWLANGKTATWNITDASDIGRGASAGSKIFNTGLFEKTSTTGVSIVSVRFTSTGTIGNAGGNLMFDGPQTSISGIYTGPGMIDYGPHGVATLGPIEVTTASCGTNLGVVNVIGTMTIHDGSTLRNYTGAQWNLAGDVNLALAAGASNPSFENDGTFSKSAGSGVSVVAMTMADTGTITASTGTIEFIGSTNSFDGVINGAGTVLFGGGANSINSSATLSVAHLAESGAGTTLTISAPRTYAGAFSVSGGATLSLASGALTLSGAATFASATVNGSNSSALATTGQTSVSGLTLGGTTIWVNEATAVESGGGFQLGDSSGAAASFATSATGVYNLEDDNGISLGASSASTISNVGLLEKTGGAGTSVIAPAIMNTGIIAALSGVLDLKSAVGGAGALQIGPGATLELDNTVASGQTVSFAGSGGELWLNDLAVSGAQLFHGVIGDFAAGDEIDVGKAFGVGTTALFTDNGSGTGGTLQLANGASSASLLFSGHYQTSNFAGSANAAGETVFAFHS